MAVPRASTIQPGIPVNIVLKKDQPTGKLTTGRVQDLLTRGDHPRGVKVRLQDGQIGRVQSLSPSSSTPGPAASDTAAVPAPAAAPSRAPRFRMQDDYRNDPVPEEERSLEDYVTFKAPRKSQKKGRRAPASASAAAAAAVGESSQGGSPKQPLGGEAQELLQAEFPGLDSALIAAILSDSESVEQARMTLGSLS